MSLDTETDMVANVMYLGIWEKKKKTEGKKTDFF